MTARFESPPGWELVSVLGEGSCFEVAIVESGGARAIAKRLNARMRAHASRVERTGIEREATTLARLSGGPVPRLLANSEDDAGPFVVETYFQGSTLREHLHGGARAAQMARLVTRVVRRLQSQDVAFVHADLGPDNFILHIEDGLQLIDFSASGFETGDPFAPIGRGTLPYVAPELCRDEAPPSRSTDRYACAVLVGDLLCVGPLCGVRGEAAQLVRVGEGGHDLSELYRSPMPESVRSALARLLAFHPRDRASSLDELADALDDWVDADASTS